MLTRKQLIRSAKFDAAIKNNRLSQSSSKGVEGGDCNRTACQLPGATLYNKWTRAYYCEKCARDIQEYASRVDNLVLFESLMADYPLAQAAVRLEE